VIFQPPWQAHQAACWNAAIWWRVKTLPDSLQGWRPGQLEMAAMGNHNVYLCGGWNCGAVNLRSGMQIYNSKRLILLNGRIWIRLFHAQRALHLDLRMILDTAQHPNFPSQIAGKENYRVESIVDPKKRKTCTFIFHWRWLQWGSIHFQRIKCMAFSSPL